MSSCPSFAARAGDDRAGRAAHAARRRRAALNVVAAGPDGRLHRRMQTYEATMHRVDAELTADLPTGPIAPDVAVGAVDHAVDVMWGWRPGVDV